MISTHNVYLSKKLEKSASCGCVEAAESAVSLPELCRQRVSFFAKVKEQINCTAHHPAGDPYWLRLKELVDRLHEIDWQIKSRSVQ